MTPEKKYVIDFLLRRIVHSNDYNFKHYLEECLLRLPLGDLKAIAYDRNIHIMSSTANTVVHLDPMVYDSGKGDRVLVVFVVNFSKSYPHETLYTIAHELAHVLLGHYDRARWKGEESELEADRQVVRWGFEREMRMSGSHYLAFTDDESSRS